MIVFTDPQVSGFHADLSVAADGTIIYTDHSTNGTMINGTHLHNASQPVSEKDTVILPGGCVLDWQAVAALVSPPAPSVEPAPAPVPAPVATPEPPVAPAPAPAPMSQYPQPQPIYQPQPVYSEPMPAPAPAPVHTPAPAPAPMPQGDISFVGVFTSFWKNYFNFSGRARRKEYWLMIVWNAILAITLIGNLVILFEFIGMFALLVRRVHDIGKSAWNLLWALLPIVGWIVMLVFLFKDSEAKTNRWGASPKYPNY